ncbi:MAG: V-type ATP synthase subunit I, partial [Treponema sp.]|nr:V-type ATP synthase subunit I [Treponema sp.]
MIVPMKKVSLLVIDKDKNDALRNLRELGVMHLVKKPVSSPELTRLSARRVQLEAAMGILDTFAPKKGAETIAIELDGDLASHIIALQERRKTLQDYMFAQLREMTRFRRWGDFNPEEFKYLAEHGVQAFLYELPLDAHEKIAGDVPLVILASDKKNNTVRVFTTQKIPNRAPYPLPEMPLSEYEVRYSLQKTEIANIDIELGTLYSMRGNLSDEDKTILEEIEFETAHAGMEHYSDAAPDSAGTDISFSWITGYVPAPDMGKLKRVTFENKWALYADDPEKDDMEVPTKLQNNKFSQLIYPLTGFMELIPGYWETDISFWFLIFFTLFFGMIFGDAAYGIILLLIALIGIAKTAKKGVPLILKFILLMSISNIIWGVLVCSWFGLDVSMVPRFLQNLSLPLIANVSVTGGDKWLDVYNAGNFWIRSGLVTELCPIEVMKKTVDRDLMLFCFTIALVQLSIAHIVNAIKTFRSLKIFAEIGRFAMILGMYFVILSLVVFDNGFPKVHDYWWQYGILVGGFVLVFIFGSYEGSVLKSLGESCKNIITVILSITNVFSDIMSYIRLWAVGLAGAAIAKMINNLTTPMFSHFAIFAAVGILFF